MSFLPSGIGIAAVLAFSAAAHAQNSATDLTPFPAAGEGKVRQVILLPEHADEDALQVEIVAGKQLEVDCNNVMIGAKAETKTVEGWGYDFLEVTDVSPPATTLMACPDNKKEERFVPINIGSEALRRYNSKLPLVVYAPKDVTVKYRIWRADAELLDAKPE